MWQRKNLQLNASLNQNEQSNRSKKHVSLLSFLPRSSKHFKEQFIPHYTPVFKDGWVPPDVIAGKDVSTLRVAIATNAANAAAVAQLNDGQRKVLTWLHCFRVPLLARLWVVSLSPSPSCVCDAKENREKKMAARNPGGEKHARVSPQDFTQLLFLRGPRHTMRQIAATHRGDTSRRQVPSSALILRQVAAIRHLFGARNRFCKRGNVN